MEAQTKRILIVEHDETVRQCMRLFFEGAGFQVDEAEDGSSAKNYLDQESYDLVISEVEIKMAS